jgi:hypothetical protein
MTWRGGLYAVLLMLFLGLLVAVVWLLAERTKGREAWRMCESAYVRCRTFCGEVASGQRANERPSSAGPCEWPLSEDGRGMKPLGAVASDPVWYYACVAQCGVEAVRCPSHVQPCTPGAHGSTR